MASIDQTFTAGEYRFRVVFDPNALPGGEWSALVFENEKRAMIRRTFYFERDPEPLMRAFGHQFAREAHFREECAEGKARWARLDRWYQLNAQIYMEKDLGIKDTTQLRREFNLLYALLDKGLEALESYQAYRQLLAEEATLHGETGEVDPGARQAVDALNAITGVQVKGSCEGMHEAINLSVWKYGPIWLPSKHVNRAFLQLEEAPTELVSALHAKLREANLGAYDAVRARLTSAAIEKNRDFLAFIVEFAGSYRPEDYAIE